MKEKIKAKKYSENVNFIGRLENNEIADFWHTNDIFISLSETEGLSVSMLEAMAGGATCIVTDVNEEVPKVINHGETGFLVPTDNWIEMIEYIEKIDRNREILRNIGEKAKLYVKNECRIDGYIDYLIENII